jgi:methylated-DNA-protein-cysteine methyltransferase related protein
MRDLGQRAGRAMSTKRKKRKIAGYFEIVPRERRKPATSDRHAVPERDEALRRAILSVPPGKVSSYGRVAASAGYPRYHRLVARILGADEWDVLPWHRILGADGKLKTSGASAKEQRARLKLEGVPVIAGRIDMKKFQF